MRTLAWVLIVVTAVALLVAGYELATMRLVTGEVQVEVTPAAQNEALFEQLRADMANNALTGRVFTGESIGDIGLRVRRLHRARAQLQPAARGMD